MFKVSQHLIFSSSRIVGPAFSERNNELVWDETATVCDLWFRHLDSISTRNEDGSRSAVDNDVTLSKHLKLITSAKFSNTIDRSLHASRFNGLQSSDVALLRWLTYQ